MINNVNIPIVSVIMPAYNGSSFISDSITSVLSQTFKNIELIIIDDGSSDETVEIIDKFKEIDNRVKLLQNDENQGVSYSRNRGIEISKGEWIAFIDCDDIWEKEKLELQLNYHEVKSADFIFTSVKYIDENGKYLKGTFNVPMIVNYKKLKMQNYISCSSVLIKKSLLENIRMGKDDIHEDYAFWLRILKKGTTAFGMPDKLLKYRLHPNSKSGKKLKTFKMTYGVFRYIGYSPLVSFYYTLNHIIRSVFKYLKIHQLW